MDPAQFNPPLPYDRYVNRELPILPHSASSQSISHDFFDDNSQGNLSQGNLSQGNLPQHGGGVQSNMAADPFSQQFEKPMRMSGRPVLPWMGPGTDHGLVDLSPSDCGQLDPMMMTTQMQPMSSVGHMNGGSMPVDKVLSAVSARDKNAPTTVRSWTLTRQSTVTQRKPCWTDCRPCQYIGLFVFVGVLAVIGYAVYNGVIAAVDNKSAGKESNHGNATYWTTTMASTNGSSGVATTTTKSSTSTTSTTTTTATPSKVEPKKPTKKRKKKKPTKPTTTTTTTTTKRPTTTTTTRPTTTKKPTTVTTKLPKTTKPAKPKKPVSKVKKEPAFCSYSIGRLMRKVRKDDGRCANSPKGIFATENSCTQFHVCYTGGRLLAVGYCPCGRIFDEETRRCMKQRGGYYRHPFDCERYFRCSYVMASAIRLSLRCGAGLAFDVSSKKPVCKDPKYVPGCNKS